MKTIRDRNTREDYVREEGHAQGHMEGHAQGRVLGREEAICDLVQKKLANGESIPQIAKDLLDTPEHISEIIEHSGNHPRETL